MSAEQDRAAATLWVDDRIASYQKGWWRPEWHISDVESAYLAGLTDTRAQTAELVEALRESNALLGGIPACKNNPKVAAQIHANRAALANVTP